METPASLALALNLSTQCAYLSSSQGAQARYPAQHPSSTASAWGLTHITDVSIVSDSKASTATLELSAESPPVYSKFLKMAFSSVPEPPGQPDPVSA